MVTFWLVLSVVAGAFSSQTAATPAPSGACEPSFAAIANNRLLPDLYVTQGLETLDRLSPAHVILAQRRDGRIGSVNYSLFVHKSEPAAATATIEGAAVFGSKAWTFSATCRVDLVADGLITTIEQIAALPSRAWVDEANPFGPRIPPTADANPAIRHPVDVRVPTALVVVRNADTASVGTDPATVETVHLTVGEHMTTGMQFERYVYPEGAARPAQGAFGLQGGLDFRGGRLEPVRLGALHPLKLDGIQRYVVEIVLTWFETDQPADHMWSPQGPKYRVLLTRTLRTVVQ